MSDPASPTNDQVAAMLAVAFGELPTAAWVVPDPADRIEAIQAQFTLLVEHAETWGGIETRSDSDGLTAAVVWLDHTGEVPAIPDYEDRMRHDCKEYADRFFALDAIMDDHHPTEAHLYLALVGVRADRRGRSIATAMLTDLHQRPDLRAKPAYLEAVSPATASLYERVGYRPHARPFNLEPAGPALYPMWRPAPDHN